MRTVGVLSLMFLHQVYYPNKTVCLLFKNDRGISLLGIMRGSKDLLMVHVPML